MVTMPAPVLSKAQPGLEARHRVIHRVNNHVGLNTVMRIRKIA